MMNRVVAFCVLTGRRESVDSLTANFEKIDDFHVMFSGQLKRQITIKISYSIANN